MNKEQAKQRLQTLIDEDLSVRSWNEAYWQLAQMYDCGKQWGYAVPNSAGLDLRYLRTRINPNRDDVRVIRDETHKHVQKFRAMLKPSRIACDLKPRSDHPEGVILANAGRAILENHLVGIGALEVLRDRDNSRCVFGSWGIRRSINTVGRPRELPGGLQHRNFTVTWHMVPPWELLRSATASSLRPSQDELDVAHCQIRSAKWVEQHWGVKVEHPTEAGKLIGFQRQLRSASWGEGTSGMDAKTPSVLWYEHWMRDAVTDPSWPTLFVAYRTHDEKNTPLHPVRLVRNPYHGLPIHLYWFDHHAQSPWGRGIPHICMQGQQITNLAWTWMCRTMQAGAGKWVAEKGTIEDGAIDNDIRKPIFWSRSNLPNPASATAPTRTSPPQISTAAIQIAQAGPQWVQESLNLSDIQSGNVSKRGESGEAIRLRLEKADDTLNDIRREDELSLQRLLFGTLVDMVNHMRADELSAIAGGDVPEQHVYALKRQPVTETLLSAVTLPAMTRPKTPTQVQEDYVAMVGAQIMQAPDATWEMGTQGGVWLEQRMRGARDKQLTEIQAMLQGRPAQVDIAENHAYHLRTIEEFIEAPRWLTLDAQVQELIRTHWLGHKQAQMALMGNQGMQAPSPQGSPPSEAVTNAAMGPAGAGTAAISVA